MDEEGQFDEPEWMKDEAPDPDSKGPLFVMRERLSYLDVSGRVRKGSIQHSRGGYSDVFSGTYTHADGSSRAVAVKELRVHIMKERKLQRNLARELYVWSKLDHPHILPFYGFYIEHNIYPHLVSPWMKNGTVMSYLESNPSADVVSLARGIAEGIRYLHANGIIHSDIKPDNVLMSDLERPLLCDFGVSRIMQSSESFQTSTTNAARGTLRYMAREVILSEDGATYSKQVDVWAFGMTVYTLITKCQPYHHIRVDAAVIFEIYTGKLPSWPQDSESWPAVDRGLKLICESCWSEKPERPPMEKIVSRLDTLVNEYRLSTWAESLTAMRSELAFNMRNIESSYLRNSAVPRPEDDVENDGLNALKHPILNWVHHASQADDIGIIRDDIVALLSSFVPLYWIEALSLFGELETGKSMLRMCTDKFGDDDRIALTAREWHAFISDYYDAILANVPHVYISALSWGGPNSVRCLRERRLLVSDDYGIPEPPADEPEGTSELNRILRDANCLSFSPNGSKFASGHRDGSLRIWDAITCELIRTVDAHDDAIRDVKFSSEGSRIVTGSRDKTVRIWDAESGKLVVGPLRGHAKSVCAVAYSTDGRSVVSGSEDKTIRVWDAQSNAVIGKPLIGHDRPVITVAYAPDDRTIVSGSADNTLRIWDPRTGKQIGQPLRNPEHQVRCVVFSADGSRIVSGSDDMAVRMWNARTGREVGEPMKGHEGSVQTVACTPDGSRIVSGSRDNTFRIWDAHAGNAIGVIPRGESRWDSDRGCFLSIPSWWPVFNPKREPLIYSDAPIQIPDDGWLRTLSGHLFLWVPHKYRDDVCRRGPMGNIPPRLKFDWKRVPHGKDWSKVKEMLEEPLDK